ncbi:inositol monophosphatase family protein [Streptococcus cameli]
METKYLFAQQIVKEAGEFLRENLHVSLTIHEKSHFTDLVTHLDQQVEADLTQKILESYPNDMILGEETTSQTDIHSGNVWVIDPIDGTTNFIAQREDFAVLVAYYENGIGQFGLIYDVMKDELICGGGDFPVELNGKLLLPFKKRSLKESLVGINAGLYQENCHGLADLAKQTLGTRSTGSAGISFSKVLKNQLLLVASNLYPWDYAAASILGKSLGYTLLCLDGEKLTYRNREMVILLPKAMEKEIKGYLK